MTDHERKAVIFLLTPPESLRDSKDIARIRAVLWHNRERIIDEMARTVMRAWTSEPEDAATTRAVIDNLEQHHRDLVIRQRGGG